MKRWRGWGVGHLCYGGSALVVTASDKRAVLGIGCDRECLHDHLFAAEERVADEFSGAQRYWLLSVCHLRGLEGTASLGLWVWV